MGTWRVPPRQVSGFGAAVVSPHHLSTQAALEILGAGGNAVDGAVAANAVQGVVAPETCGIGGDLFAVLHRPDQDIPEVLNASGRAGSGADPATLRSEGFTAIPSDHPQAVTVPGCVDGWTALLQKHGTMSLGEVLAPALRHARRGFAASDELAASLGEQLEELAPLAPELYPSGRAPRPGTRIRRPALAAILHEIATGGRDAFYQGRAAAAIQTATRGQISLADLAPPHADWVEPLGLQVFGRTGWTVPPNSQGYLTLAAGWIVEHLGPPHHYDDPGYTHSLIEAYRSVAWERDDLVADPDHSPMPLDRLLDQARLAERASAITQDSTADWPAVTAPPGGTAFMCVLDEAGLGVALIQSDFTGFGTGIVARGAGFFLHSRGAGFDLRPDHPNELSPGKRPLHTLSPTLWTTGDHRLELLLGTRGAHYQPQLLLQAAAHHLYLGTEPGEAQSFPRWVIDAGGSASVQIESRTPAPLVEALASKGHRLIVRDAFERGWGPVSMIRLGPDDLRTAAADPRVETATAAVL